MTETLFSGALVALLLASQSLCAAEARINVTDRDGTPLADAVVELTATQAIATPAANTLKSEAIVDQRHETFIPLVTLIRQGGHVIFTNDDTTMHQVYSFSSIRQFAFEIDEGQRSAPVVFDTPGVAAIGCNIHDRMITYVYVSGQPWAAVSDAAGHGWISGLPAGPYSGRVWHPLLPPGSAPASFSIHVTAAGSSALVSLPVSAGNVGPKKQMHMQMY